MIQTNKATITVITTTVAIIALLCAAAICYLSYLRIEIPPELNTLAGIALGALTGMLVKTSPSEATPAVSGTPPPTNGPMPVTVENKPTDPVPTIEALEK